MPHPPVVLVIAGSDAGGGAGLQADLGALRDHGVWGTTAITAVTAQDTVGVQRVDALSPEAVVAQVNAVRGDMAISAVKIGMLGGAPVCRAVADLLAGWPDRPAIVLDPVMVATSGDRLLDEDAVEVLRDRLVPLATVVTPNQPEAELLSGRRDGGEVLAAALVRRGARAALVTGGDAATDDVVDVLCSGRSTTTWRNPRVAGGPFHGTGCTLASAVAARLARGEDLTSACEGAVSYVQARLRAAWALGRGSRVLGWHPDHVVVP